MYLPKTCTRTTITQNPSTNILGYMDPLGSKAKEKEVEVAAGGAAAMMREMGTAQTWTEVTQA